MCSEADYLTPAHQSLTAACSETIYILPAYIVYSRIYNVNTYLLPNLQKSLSK